PRGSGGLLNQSIDWDLRTLTCARNYPDVICRNLGQFASKEIGARSALRATDRLEIRPGARSDGASFALTYATKLWTDDAPVRSAISFQRMHQQLSLLRFLARQSDPACHPRGGWSGCRSPASRSSRISADPSRRRRASEICEPRLSGRMLACACPRLFVNLYRGRPDGD